MRISLSENNRPDRVIAAVRNLEATATIPRGTPLILNLSSTPKPSTAADGFTTGYEDGLGVVLPSTAGQFPAAMFFYGVAVADILPGQLGESVIFGIAPYALCLFTTRSASAATWASSASSSSAGGYCLSIDTVNNCFFTYQPSTPGASWTGTTFSGTTGVQQVAAQWFNAIMVDSVSSQASSTSFTSLTVSTLPYGVRAFVRAM